MSFLDLKNVTKIYPNGTKAVHETSLSIDEGEFMVFVGPSGCGKSTLLRMVAGLEDITEGDINLDGKLINEVDPSERDVAMVFQNYALYPHMNVYNNCQPISKCHSLDLIMCNKYTCYSNFLLKFFNFKSHLNS